MMLIVSRVVITCRDAFELLEFGKGRSHLQLSAYSGAGHRAI
jgi:hypothetical protein